MLTPPRPLTEVQTEEEKSRGLSRLCPETTLIKIRTRDDGEGCQRLHLWKEIQTDVTGPGLRVFNAEADTGEQPALVRRFRKRSTSLHALAGTQSL